MKKDKIYSAYVIHGRKMGRVLGFPTVNLNHKQLKNELRSGVYATRVYIEEKEYLGLLYRGPRLILNDRRITLEIFILDFKGKLYGSRIKFSLINYIREVVDFNNEEEYKKQLEKDIKKARKPVKGLHKFLSTDKIS